MPAGTYLGLVEKLDYLQALGVNAIELLPVQEFNELEYYQVQPWVTNISHSCTEQYPFHITKQAAANRHSQGFSLHNGAP